MAKRAHTECVSTPVIRQLTIAETTKREKTHARDRA